MPETAVDWQLQPSLHHSLPTLLVIFGAGASHDCGGGSRAELQRIPLAADLVSPEFSSITLDIPGSRAIVDRLRYRMTGNRAGSLESELALIVERSKNSPERRQQLIAFRFYLFEVIRTKTQSWTERSFGFGHYLTLLNYLYDWQQETGAPIRVATFNYDTLIDSAAVDVFTGLALNTLPDYIGRDDFRFFKLHGSTAWSRVIPDQPNAYQQVLPRAMELAAAGTLDSGMIMARPPLGRYEAANEITLPALAVPMADKTEFECPEEHLAALKTDLPRITHVLIIGWRAAEPHAVQLLEGSIPQEGVMPGYSLGIVSGSPEGALETFDNLGTVAARGRLTFVESSGFSAFIENLDVHMADLFGPNLTAPAA